MTEAEQRLIDAARARAICNDRYGEAQDAVAMNMNTADDLYIRAGVAGDKAYQAVLDAEPDREGHRAFEAARMKRDSAQEACKLAEGYYQLALQALTESPA